MCRNLTSSKWQSLWEVTSEQIGEWLIARSDDKVSDKNAGQVPLLLAVSSSGDNQDVCSRMNSKITCAGSPIPSKGCGDEYMTRYDRKR